ncbi:MAG: hypothetical protein WCQ95_00175 [Bacteroidota bacterium]
MKKIIIYPKEKKLLAQRLTELFLASGLSKKHIARSTGIRLGDFNAILAGEANLTDETRIKILAELGITWRQFYQVDYLDQRMRTLKDEQESINSEWCKKKVVL